MATVKDFFYILQCVKTLFILKQSVLYATNMLVTVEASVFVQLNCSKKYSCRSSTYHQFKAEYQNYHIYISSMQAILNQIIARKKRVHKYAPFKTESIFIQNSNTR